MNLEKELFESIAKGEIKQFSPKQSIDAEADRIWKIYPRAIEQGQSWAFKSKLAVLAAADTLHDSQILTNAQRTELRELLNTMLANYNNLDKRNKAESIIAGVFEEDAQF